MLMKRALDPSRMHPKRHANLPRVSKVKETPTVKTRRRRAPVIIRDMSIDDLSEVFHLGESLFTSAFSPNLYRTWDEYEVTGLYENDSELCLVAEVDEKIVGFMMGTTVEKHGTAWKYGYVVWMGVKEEHQGLGTATKLYREIENRMRDRGTRMIIADTDESNEAAVGFFQKLGFAKAGSHIWLSKNVSYRRRRKNAANQ